MTRLLVLCLFPVLGWSVLAAGAPESTLKYFRSDAGIAGRPATGLPENLGDSAILRWRVPLDSGQSTPIICANRIFVTTYNSASNELATVALDQATGKMLWRSPAPTTKIEEYHPKSGNPATATPACDGQRLYVFYGSCGLTAFDLDGKKIWEQPMGPFRDEYGACSSPILVDDKIILNQDHDIDSFLIAINRFNGKLMWKTPRPNAVRSYSTPTIWQRAGRKELLVAGALELAGYDIVTGEKLWWQPGLARIVIPIPVPGGEMIYMASWSPGGDTGARINLGPWENAVKKWDKNNDGELARPEVDDATVLERFFRMDLDQSGKLIQAEWDKHAEIFRRAQNVILAIKPSTDRGELSASDVVWQYPRGVPYVATPLFDQGVVWMVKDGGIVTKLEGATGQVLTEERLRGLGGYYASPVTGDGKVYFASEQGVVTVVANSKEWQIVSSHEFKEKIYATPVIDGDKLYVRTEKALYCFGAGKPN